MKTHKNQTSFLAIVDNQEDAETAIADASPDFSAVRFDYFNDEIVYSVVDAIASLMEIDYNRARNYWKNLKQSISKEQSGMVTICYQLKMVASDGKRRETDVMTRQQILRLIQSIPSPKVEQWKQWLALQGEDSLARQEDAETAIADAIDTVDYHLGKYRKAGKTDAWINERVDSIVDRKRFTDALHNAVVDIIPTFYAQSTELIYKGVWDRTTAQLRSDLDIPRKANPRDHFGAYALTYTRLAEMLASEMLEQVETVSMAVASDIIWRVAKLVKAQVEQTAQLVGVDLVTGKPLLGDGNNGR